MDIDKILSSLTIEEKIKMLSGKDFWRTVDFPEKGVDSFEVADGPYGVRKQTGLCDHMGWNKSVPATAYVSGPGLAASFDTDLASETGKHLAAEARSLGVDILLGPAVNIVRTPLCGRTFEYYSEDPVLAGEMAASYINGVQSQGVGTCIKHFAANNQEIDREYIDVIAEERTLREIYLKVFEIATEKSHPWAFMTALNKVNGSYCSENEWLLSKVLRKEWDYDCLVMSDWSGVNNRERALKAGLDLEMPYSYGVSEERLLKAYGDGSLSEDVIDTACLHILKTLEKVLEGRKVVPCYMNADHNAFAREMAEKSAILMKNDNSVLPLKKDEKILVCGNFAINPRFKMEGSALVNPTSFDIPLDEIKKIGGDNIYFSECYDSNSNIIDSSLSSAVDIASKVDKVVVFAGLPDGIEAEGKDRKNLFIPESHRSVIRKLSQVNSNLIVVLLNGSPVDMSWDESASAVLEMFLAGQCLGGAVANLLYGVVSPGGKLPMTFPSSIEQSPAYLNYPGYSGKVNYGEGVFIGYRYYITKDINVRYPFGYGLSYSRIDVQVKGYRGDGNKADVNVYLENTGKYKASETVQIYVESPKTRIPRPKRTLVAFKRVYLNPAEGKLINFSLTEKDFEYFDPDLNDWYASKGRYRIVVATSSVDDVTSIEIDINPKRLKFEEITGWSSVGELRSTKAGEEAYREIKRILKESGNAQAQKLPIFKKNGESEEQVNKIPLRMITVLTDNVLNNDIMDDLISTVNNKNLEACR